MLDHVECDSFGMRIDSPAVDAAFVWTGRDRDPLTGLQYNNPAGTTRQLAAGSAKIHLGLRDKYAYIGNVPTMYIGLSYCRAPSQESTWRLYCISWFDDAIVARISLNRPATFSFAGPLGGPPCWSLSLRPGKSERVGSVLSKDCFEGVVLWVRSFM